MYYVYILTNIYNKVLYTGVTNDLIRRLYEHQNKIYDGFTAKYNVHKLVYFDYVEEVLSVIEREKQIKGWTRQKKIRLIETMNPNWDDLLKTLQ